MNRSGGAIAFREERQDATLDMVRAGKVIRHQHLPLQHTEHDLDLVEPGGVHRQPMDADLEAQPEREDPGGQLLRSVSRTVILDQMEHANPLAPQAGEQHPQEGLEFSESLPLKTPRQRLPAVHQQAGEQLHGPFPLIPVADMYSMAGRGGGRAAGSLSSLDRCLLVRADDDVAFPAQLLRSLVQVENGDRLFKVTEDPWAAASCDTARA